MSQPRRRFGRFEREVPVSIVVEGAAAEAQTVNIGLGGMAVRTDLTPAYDSDVEFRIELPQPQMTVQARGKVLWSRDTGAEGGTVGISFEALRPIDVWALLQYFTASSAGTEEQAVIPE
jgi:hypothetical protein